MSLRDFSVASKITCASRFVLISYLRASALLFHLLFFFFLRVFVIRVFQQTLGGVVGKLRQVTVIFLPDFVIAR